MILVKKNKEEILETLRENSGNLCVRISKNHLNNTTHFYNKALSNLATTNHYFPSRPLLTFVLGGTIFIGVNQAGQATQYNSEIKHNNTKDIAQGRVYRSPEQQHELSDSLLHDDIKVIDTNFETTGEIILGGVIEDVYETNEDGSAIYQFYSVDEKPVFPGGMSALMSYFVNEFNGKNAELPKGYHEKIYIECIIKSNGSIENYSIIRNNKVSSKVKKEIFRLISEMPLWTAGKHNGEHVDVRFIIPFNISRPK